jgi:LacI family transcriptional regulator
MTDEEITAPEPAGDLPSRSRGQRAGPTIRDVARLANVSIGTVSKALNNSGSLRRETRERIAAIAAEIGFRPNDLAQSLHRGQSFTVGLISNDSFGRFTMPIMEGLEAALADERIAVFMCNATDDPARERQHVEQLMGKRVDGLVFTARRADRRPTIDLGVAGVPIVYVFAQSDDPKSLALLPDDEGGERLATEHLIGLGRKRIAHFTGPERFEAVRLRRDGYFKALRAAGLPQLDGYYRPGNWSEEYGREAAAALFAGRGPHPDGIVCGNDQIARGAEDALREIGVDVPGDVSVVGFDNWEVMANAARPPLTSVDLNLPQLGRTAGECIVRMIKGEHLNGVRRLDCALVVRESCGAHRSERAPEVKEGGSDA